MENITYTKTLSCSIPWTLQKTQWFGCSEELTKGIPLNEYLTNTKNQKSEIEKTTEIFKRLERAHNHAQNKVESNKTVAHNIELHKREILYLTQEIDRVKKTQEIISKSALKIQKVARGYLARKGLETEILAIRRKSVNSWVSQLKKTDNYYIYQLGPKPQKAALIIQRFARNLLFRFKIRRISHIYEIIQIQKIEAIENAIRASVRVLYSCSLISNAKFELFKAKRLKEIREKLAIFSVKYFWRKSKFTFKIILQKIKKFKRMVRNEQRLKKPSTTNLAMAGSTKRPDQIKENLLSVTAQMVTYSSRGSLYDDMDSQAEQEEVKQVIEEVGSVTSEINRRLEMERQEKIASAKKAYNIPKNKELPNVLPYLYQKDILEGVSPPSHYATTTRAMVFRMNHASPKRLNPRKFQEENEKTRISRLAQIKPYTPNNPRPKLGHDGNPLYMKPTTASKMSRWDAEGHSEDIDEQKKVAQPREDSKITSPTFASMQKVCQAYSNKEKFDKKPIWRPNTQFTERYVPNLDNLNYVRTPKRHTRPATMCFSPRVDEKRQQIENFATPETKMEVNTLSFEAALPGLASLLNSYGKFQVRVKPKFERIR